MRRCSSMLRSRSTASTSPRPASWRLALGGRRRSGARSASPAPASATRELEAAIAAGVTLNCESEGEAERALAIGERLGRTPRLAVRVNPDFEIKGSGMRMGGGAKPFGVDAARVPALVRRIIAAGADWRGFHIFAGSQALDADALIEAQRATLALAARAGRGGRRARRRWSISAAASASPISTASSRSTSRRSARRSAKRSAAAPAILADTHFAIELGRWLVGEAGVYLTRIVDRKESHGKTFLVTDGGLHHQLAASGNFGQVVRRNYPVAIASRFGAEPEEEVSIVGCLCTPLDRLADDVMLPRAEVGDLVAIFLAGAYGLSASPQAFLGQRPAREMARSSGGGLTPLRQRRRSRSGTRLKSALFLTVILPLRAHSRPKSCARIPLRDGGPGSGASEEDDPCAYPPSPTLALAAGVSALALAGCATGRPHRQQPARRPASSAPATTAVSEKYIIGALDELTVFVWRNPELGAKVQVRPDGRITTPLITDMVAVGKTPAQLADDIRQALDPIYRRSARLGDGRPARRAPSPADPHRRRDREAGLASPIAPT